MSTLNALKIAGRAAVVAAALSASALVAAPAMAAPPPPNINFSLQLGNGFGFGGNGVFLNFGNGPKMFCLSDNQIRYQLQYQGWKFPKVVNTIGPQKVVAVAMWQGMWYQMRVDRCSGKVDKVKPVYQKPNGNFSITLNF